MSLPKPRRSVVALSLAVAATATIAPFSSSTAAPPAAVVAPAPDPVRVVIEVDGPTAAAVVGNAALAKAHGFAAGSPFATRYAAAVASVEQTQDAALVRATSAGVRVTDQESLTGVLNAVVATVDASDLATLRATPGVARVTEDMTVRALGEPNIPSTGADDVWTQDAPGGGKVKGDGVTVAIVDTGIDYDLDDLGGGFGDGFRVVGGYDVYNDDADPMDDNSHGTHVAGIVAGAGTTNVVGMAPDVSLTAWKVLNESGQGEMSDVLVGFESAVDPLGAHPADVVNLSLGSEGDGTDPMGRAATAAVRQGVVVVAAAGNAGGAQTIGSPGAAPGVLTVGADVTGVDLPTLSLKVPGAGVRPLTVGRFPLSANPPAAGLTAGLVEVGDGFEDAYAAAGDVTGKIVVVQSYVVGSLDQIQGGHLQQAMLAEEHGAVGMLLYTPSPTDPGGGGDGPVRPTAAATPPDVHVLDAGGFDLRRESLVMMTTTSAQYQTFKAQVLAGTASATVGSVDATDQVADFSSRGPTDAMTLKPEIVAPGFEIMSTLPSSFEVEGNRYRMSGTSMAAPHVAGAAALMVQAHPDLTATEIRAALIGSARRLDSADAGASPSAQGAGTLDVAAAVDQHVTASPDVVSFGLADMAGAGRRTETVVLRNDGDAAVTVSFAVRASDASTGTATLSAKNLTIGAGRSASVDLRVTPKIGAVDAETSGVVVGRVSDGSTIRVPFAAYVRPLIVQATPDPALGSSQVFVYSGSSLLPDGAVTLTATGPSGRRTATALTAEAGNAGWYRGTLPLEEVGEHTLLASASIDGRTVTGSSTIRSAARDEAGAWKQVGLTGEAAWLAVSPGAPGTALGVTTDSAYPMVTTDRGVTWTRTRSMPVAAGWGIPVADPRTPGAFYLGLNGAFGQVPLDPSYQGRIVHTADAGRTWTVLPFRDTAILALMASGSSLVAVVNDGVEISDDGGATWRHVEQVWDGGITDAALAGDDLVVSGYFGIWRLADVTGAGDEIVQTYTPTDQLIYGLGADADGAVAVLSDGSMVRSSDDGVTWTATGDSGQSYVTDVQVVDGRLYLSGLFSYTTSDDYGTTLAEHALPVDGPLITDVDRWPGSPAGSALISMENAGLYETDDGDAWSKIGLSATSVSSVSVGTDADGTAVLRATDQEGVHERALADLAPSEQDWGSTGNEGYYGVALSQVEQSTVDGRVWSIGADAVGTAKIAAGAPGEPSDLVGPHSSFGTSALALSPSAANTVAVGYSALGEAGWIVSTDGFATWTTYDVGHYVNQLAFDPTRKRRLWIATADGLFRSDDLGATTTRLTTAPAESVLVDGQRVVVGEQGGIRYSTDGGATFRAAVVPSSTVRIGTLTSLTLPSGRLKGVEVLVAGAQQWSRAGLAINGGGAYVSTDLGRTWVPASGGLTAMSVRSLAVSADGAWVYAGTDDGGVHRTTSSSLVPASAVAKTKVAVKASGLRVGRRTTLDVVLTAASGKPTGTVKVTIARRGGGASYTKVLTLKAGKATWTTPVLAKAGGYVVTATYRPTGLFQASTGTKVVTVRR